MSGGLFTVDGDMDGQTNGQTVKDMPTHREEQGPGCHHHSDASSPLASSAPLPRLSELVSTCHSGKSQRPQEETGRGHPFILPGPVIVTTQPGIVCLGSSAPGVTGKQGPIRHSKDSG